MPVVELETNIHLKVEDSKALVVKLSKLSSQILGNPENVTLVKYTHNEALCWEGTFDPTFILSVGSIKGFSPEKNPSIIEQYTNFLKENLGADDKRGFVVLRDGDAHTTGYKGTTIAKLLNL